jgi:hypothetical protein
LEVQIAATGEKTVEKAEEQEETVEKTEEYSASMQQAMGTCESRFLLFQS